jgi:hypothetical protein
MSEPVGSFFVAGVYKVLASVFGASLACVVVMSLTQPRTRKEWIVALICTVVSSIGGGGFLVRYFNFNEWINEPFGIFAIMSFCFACGLPAWVLVRWWFGWVVLHPNENPLNPMKDFNKNGE